MNPEERRGAPEGEQVVHEVDGIQELDNRLPNWWLYTLFGSIVFAIGYWFVYQVFGAAELPVQAYRREAAALAARQGKTVAVTGEALVEMSKDPSILTDGKQTFVASCAPCHGVTGGGNIGPNLTDGYWLHGGAPEKIYATIHDGVAAKGMPAWGPQLGDVRTQAVAAYVVSLRNTNVPGGKPPQGDPELASREH